jgi:hypothetical protein
MTHFVQRVALFWVRLTLLVVTAIALMAVEFEHGIHVSDVGSPLVAFHRLEWAVLPLLAIGWFLERGASRALRRERRAS